MEGALLARRQGDAVEERPRRDRRRLDQPQVPAAVEEAGDAGVGEQELVAGHHPPGPFDVGAVHGPPPLGDVPALGADVVGPADPHHRPALPAVLQDQLGRGVDPDADLAEVHGVAAGVAHRPVDPDTRALLAGGHDELDVAGPRHTLPERDLRTAGP